MGRLACLLAVFALCEAQSETMKFIHLSVRLITEVGKHASNKAIDGGPCSD